MDPDFGRHEWGDRGRRRTVVVGCALAASIGAATWLVTLGVILLLLWRS
jgi:hypothetical protein